jgi:hypothetical protein
MSGKTGSIKARIVNSHLLKIKGQEIASIVCKKEVTVNFAEEEERLGIGPFNLISPVYVFLTRGEGTEFECKIVIDKKILGEDPLQILRNFRVFVSHEASHVYMTEFSKWRHWHKADQARAFIANLIEDERCNNFLINRYPGLRRDFASYFANSFLHHKNVQDVSEDLRFTVALVQAATFGRIKGDITTLSKAQLEKITKIQTLLDGIKWACLFEEELLPCAERIYPIFSSERYPRDQLEGEAFLSASFTENIMAEEKDTGIIKSSSAIRSPGPDETSHNFSDQTAGEGWLDDHVEKIMKEFSARYSVDLAPSEVEKKLIEDIFGVETDKALANMKKWREERVKDQFSKESLGVILPRENLDFYYKCKAEVLPQIKRLTTMFELIRQAEDWQENFISGQNLTFDFVQRYLNKDRHLFKRYLEKESEIKWLILTDVSSSVSSHEVTKLTTILSEVANTIFNRNDFCMCAFSENFYVIKDFDEAYDKLVRARIGGMYSGGTTNICDSVDFCINRFNRFPSETKVLIVITDGEPNTCRDKNPREHTKVAVRRAFSKDIFTIGIGTRDNQSVQEYFPVNFTIKSFEAFPKLFLEILAKVLFEPEK